MKVDSLVQLFCQTPGHLDTLVVYQVLLQKVVSQKLSWRKYWRQELLTGHYVCLFQWNLFDYWLVWLQNHLHFYAQDLVFDRVIQTRNKHWLEHFVKLMLLFPFNNFITDQGAFEHFHDVDRVIDDHQQNSLNQSTVRPTFQERSCKSIRQMGFLFGRCFKVVLQLLELTEQKIQASHVIPGIDSVLEKSSDFVWCAIDQAEVLENVGKIKIVSVGCNLLISLVNEQLNSVAEIVCFDFVLWVLVSGFIQHIPDVFLKIVYKILWTAFCARPFSGILNNNIFPR